MVSVPSPRGGEAHVEVNDSKWRELLTRAYGLNESYVKVGVLESRGGGDLTEGTLDEVTLAQIAASHEFGDPEIHVPERSFIRSTFLVRRANALKTMTARLCRQVVTDNMPPERALALLGQWAASEVRATITEIEVPPPLAPSTIAAKGSSRPLVDEGRLLNSLGYEVVPEGSE